MRIFGRVIYGLIAVVLFISIFYRENIEGVEKRYLWIIEGILLIILIIYEFVKRKKPR
jgi:ABC-type glucose/galactose transport system permease subunit